MGSLTGAKLAQRFGRKGTLLLDVVPLFLGAFLCATASSFNWLVAGRSLVGVGIGLASGLVPLFISEVSPVLSAAHYLRAPSCSRGCVRRAPVRSTACTWG